MLEPACCFAVGEVLFLELKFIGAMTILKELERLIQPELDALGFVLVRLQFVAGADEQTLQIMAERPSTGQLTIDDCAALSRRVSEKFDQLDPISDSYRLEVSSPGIDRLLTRSQDFVNWAGHEARINLVDKVANKKQLRGELLGLDDDEVIIADRKAGEQKVALSNIHSAKLVLTDKLLAASMPVSLDGVDEIENELVEVETEE